MKKNLIYSLIGLILSGLSLMIGIAEMIFSFINDISLTFMLVLIILFCIIFVANLANYIYIKHFKFKNSAKKQK